MRRRKRQYPVNAANVKMIFGYRADLFDSPPFYQFNSLASHIQDLLMDLDVPWLFTDRITGSALWQHDELKAIITPSITDSLTYFIALHEIGHGVSGKPNSPTIVDSEAMAWNWALDNARFPILPYAITTSIDRFMTYIDRYGPTHYSDAVLTRMLMYRGESEISITDCHSVPNAGGGIRLYDHNNDI